MHQNCSPFITRPAARASSLSAYSLYSNISLLANRSQQKAFYQNQLNPVNFFFRFFSFRPSLKRQTRLYPPTHSMSITFLKILIFFPAPRKISPATLSQTLFTFLSDCLNHTGCAIYLTVLHKDFSNAHAPYFEQIYNTSVSYVFFRRHADAGIRHFAF